MKNKSTEAHKISRRRTFNLLGSALLVPFIGLRSSYAMPVESEDNPDDSQTLLKSDGSIVKVKINTLKKSKVLKKELSNKTLLSWLNRK